MLLNNAHDIMTSAAMFLSIISLVAASSSSNIHHTSPSSSYEAAHNKYTAHAVEKQVSSDDFARKALHK